MTKSPKLKTRIGRLPIPLVLTVKGSTEVFKDVLARDLLPLVFDDAPHAPPLARLHDIEVAMRVDPNPVAGAMDRAVSPARQTLAVEGQDADPAAIVLRDVNDVVIVDIEERRADQFGRPNRQQFAVLIEDLHPVVFAVGHQHPAAPVDPDAVRQVELAGRRPRFAPGEQMFGVGREFVHPGIAIAVGHEHRAVGSESDVGREVERAAAVRDLAPSLRTEIVCGHAGVGARPLFTDGLQQLPGRSEFLELLMVLIAQPDDVLPILLHDADRVRKGEQPRTPGRQKTAPGTEDYDRVVGVAVEAVDPVLRIDRNSAGANIEPRRRALPLLVDPVGIFAAADDRFHAVLLCIYVAAYDRVTPAVAASAWPDGRGSASPRRPGPAAPES